MKSKTFGPRASQARDGKLAEKDAEWEASITLADEASGVAEKLDRSSQNKFRQRPEALLMTLDTIAEGSLSPSSLARYEAYKFALIGSDQDLQLVADTLAVFIRDLFIGSSNTTLH